MPEVFIYLEDEKEQIMRLKQKPKRRFFIDIGAFLGEYCINLSENFDIIWAFEPAKDSREGLVKLRDNLNATNIQVFPEALSDFKGRGTLFRHPKSAGGGLTGQTGLKNGFGNPDSGDWFPIDRVDVVKLDDLTLDTIDLLKIDAEGNEIEVLKGAKRTLKRTKEIYIELHGPHKDALAQKVIKLLKQGNFRNIERVGNEGRLVHAERT